jgi:hypothetical protein
MQSFHVSNISDRCSYPFWLYLAHSDKRTFIDDVILKFHEHAVLSWSLLTLNHRTLVIDLYCNRYFFKYFLFFLLFKVYLSWELRIGMPCKVSACQRRGMRSTASQIYQSWLSQTCRWRVVRVSGCASPTVHVRDIYIFNYSEPKHLFCTRRRFVLYLYCNNALGAQDTLKTLRWFKVQLLITQANRRRKSSNSPPLHDLNVGP